MIPEEYRKYINQMLECIDNERDLKQIYTIVHRKFIRGSSGKEVQEGVTA